MRVFRVDKGQPTNAAPKIQKTTEKIKKEVLFTKSPRANGLNGNSMSTKCKFHFNYCKAALLSMFLQVYKMIITSDNRPQLLIKPFKSNVLHFCMVYKVF